VFPKLLTEVREELRKTQAIKTRRVPGAMPTEFTVTGKTGKPIRVYQDPKHGWMAQLGNDHMPITDEQATSYFKRFNRTSGAAKSRALPDEFTITAESGKRLKVFKDAKYGWFIRIKGRALEITRNQAEAYLDQSNQDLAETVKQAPPDLRNMKDSNGESVAENAENLFPSALVLDVATAGAISTAPIEVRLRAELELITGKSNYLIFEGGRDAAKLRELLGPKEDPVVRDMDKALAILKDEGQKDLSPEALGDLSVWDDSHMVLEYTREDGKPRVQVPRKRADEILAYVREGKAKFEDFNVMPTTTHLFDKRGNIVSTRYLHELIGERKISDIIAAYKAKYPKVDLNKLLEYAQQSTDTQHARVNEYLSGYSDKNDLINYLKDYVWHRYRSQTYDEKFFPDGALKRSENVEQTHEREIPTYRKAALIGKNPLFEGFIETYEASQEALSTLVRNKGMLVSIGLAKDSFGTPQALFSRRGIAEEEPSVFNNAQAFEMLTNLANLVAKVNLGKALKTDANAKLITPNVTRSKSPWDQITELRATMSDADLKDLGYQRLDLTQVAPADAEGNRKLSGFKYNDVWVKEGSAANLLGHITGKGFRGIQSNPVRNTLLMLREFVQLTKSLAVGISGFHVWNLSESFVAAFGLGKQSILRHPIKQVQGMIDVYREAMNNPDTIKEMIESGLMIPLKAQDYDVSRLDKILGGATELAGKIPGLGLAMKPPLQATHWLKKSFDKFLWEKMQPAMKIYVHQHIVGEVMSNPDFAAVPKADVMREVSGMVNDMFGGQNWMHYTWANPMTRDIMSLLLFAPDWTISALNTAMVPDLFAAGLGTPNFLSKPGLTPLRSKWLIQKYWPAFVTIVMAGLPQAIQAAAHGMDLALPGEPDEDHKWWTWQNEEGKKSFVDLTPLYYRVGKKFGVTQERRVYTRFGKQMLENARWFTDFPQALLSKSSVIVKMALEQGFGKNSAWWDMPWVENSTKQGPPFAGLFGVDGEFMKGRLGFLVRPFIPLTLTSFLDDRPASPFTLTTLGISKTAGIKQISIALEAYADERYWNTIKGRVDRVRRLKSLVPDILEALRLNGYHDTDAIMSEAVSRLRLRSYNMLFAELNRKAGPRESEMAYQSRRLRRLKGNLKMLKTSIKGRSTMGNYPKEETRTKLRAVAQTFRKVGR